MLPHYLLLLGALPLVFFLFFFPPSSFLFFPLSVFSLSPLPSQLWVSSELVSSTTLFLALLFVAISMLVLFCCLLVSWGHFLESLLQGSMHLKSWRVFFLRYFISLFLYFFISLSLFLFSFPLSLPDWRNKTIDFGDGVGVVGDVRVCGVYKAKNIGEVYSLVKIYPYNFYCFGFWSDFVR